MTSGGRDSIFDEKSAQLADNGKNDILLAEREHRCNKVLQVTELNTLQSITVRIKVEEKALAKIKERSRGTFAHPKCMLVMTIDRLGCKKKNMMQTL